MIVYSWNLPFIQLSYTYLISQLEFTDYYSRIYMRNKNFACPTTIYDSIASLWWSPKFVENLHIIWKSLQRKPLSLKEYLFIAVGLVVKKTEKTSVLTSSVLKMIILLITKLTKKFIKNLREKFQIIDVLLSNEREHLFNQHRRLKFVISAFYGIFFATILIALLSVLMRMKISSISIVVSLLFVLFCALSSGLSLQFRCILTLIGFECLGRGGRNFFKASLIVLLVLGPINGIVVNSMEVRRALGCSAFLAYNLTLTKYNLMFRPFTNAIHQLNFTAMEEKVDGISKRIEPIMNEIEERDFKSSKK